MSPDFQTALHTVSGLSYVGVFGLSLIANIFVPVPEEVFLLALGYLLAEGFFHPALIVVIVICGFMISDTALYFFARKGNKFLIKMRDKFLSNIGFTDGNTLSKHMTKIIFFSRFMVQFRFLGPVLAGSYHVPYKRFFAVNLVALGVYVPLVILLGDYFHGRLERVFAGIGVARNIIFAVVGVVVAIALFKFMRTLFVRYLKKMAPRMKAMLGIEKNEE